LGAVDLEGEAVEHRQLSLSGRKRKHSGDGKKQRNDRAGLPCSECLV
jgi:hypothetical protein